MDKLSKDDEKRVMGAMERVVSLTNGGSTPNDALFKVASEEKFSPPFVQRMVEAYNTSKTLSHFKHASGDDKAENFPIADAVTVLDRMYPEKVASPFEKNASVYIPEELTRPEEVDFMKKASAPLPRLEVAAYDLIDKTAKAINRYDGLVAKVAAARSDYRIAFLDMVDHVKAAAQYFKQISHEPFESVEMKVAADFGDVGRGIMEMVYQMGNLTEKRASEVLQRFSYTANQWPFAQITAAIKQADKVIDAGEKVVEAENTAETFRKSAGIPAPPSASPDPPKEESVLGGGLARPFDKGASLLEDILGTKLLVQGGQSALGLSGDSESAKRKATSEVFDPMHEAKLQSIGTQSMLNDFLSNDPIISAHDPDTVLNAYNNIAKLSPTAAGQPTLMRGMIRRMLTQENVLEPHEAGQLADIEGKMRTRNTVNPS